MLQIYNYKTDDTIMSNDNQFIVDSFKRVIANSDEGVNCRRMIEKVEGVKFISNSDNKLIISKITHTVISVDKVSTGCKTLINVLLNPDRPVFIGECGNNILKTIFKLNNGKIYSPYKNIPLDSENNKSFECCSRNKKTIITGLDALEEWYNGN